MTVFVAVWLLVIFGLAAIGVDGGYWYLQRRLQQNAADMAAVAGAIQVATDVQQGILGSNGAPLTPISSTTSATGPSSSCTDPATANDIQQSALVVSQANGFGDNQGGACVTVNWPPTSGNYTGDNAVEVILTKPAPVVLTRVISAFAGLSRQTIGARAVAEYGTINQLACVLNLTEPLVIQGSSAISAPECTFVSDATLYGSNSQNSSIYVNGNTGTGKDPTSSTSASNRDIFALAALGSCINCATATTTTVNYSGASYTPDPFNDPANGIVLSDISSAFENTTVPADKATLTSKHQTNYQTDTTLSGGLYSGIKVTAGATLTLNSGLYVIGAGGLDVASGANMTCTGGCTFLLVNGGTATVNGSTSLVLDAPVYDSTDPTKTTGWLQNLNANPTYSELSGFTNATLGADLGGVLFYGDGTGQSTINGGNGSVLSGALYFPNSTLSLSGNSNTDGTANSSCLMVVAAQVMFNGNNATGLTAEGCTDLGLPSVYVHYVKLVE